MRSRCWTSKLVKGHLNRRWIINNNKKVRRVHALMWVKRWRAVTRPATAASTDLGISEVQPGNKNQRCQTSATGEGSSLLEALRAHQAQELGSVSLLCFAEMLGHSDDPVPML